MILRITASVDKSGPIKSLLILPGNHKGKLLNVTEQVLNWGVIDYAWSMPVIVSNVRTADHGKVGPTNQEMQFPRLFIGDPLWNKGGLWNPKTFKNKSILEEVIQFKSNIDSRNDDSSDTIWKLQSLSLVLNYIPNTRGKGEHIVFCQNPIGCSVGIGVTLYCLHGVS